MLIDVRKSADFAKGHRPGSINIPSHFLAQWAGFFVADGQPVYLLTDADSLDENLRSLRSIGIDNVQGYFDIKSADLSKTFVETYPSATPKKLVDRIADRSVQLLDVRAATEFAEGHIEGAEHRFLGKLQRDLIHIDRSKPVVVQCSAGGRSAIAASILQKAGFDVINMSGGYEVWQMSGLPTYPEKQGGQD
jgi:hydroxyacylglutathione hydrolase